MELVERIKKNLRNERLNLMVEIESVGSRCRMYSVGDKKNESQYARYKSKLYECTNRLLEVQFLEQLIEEKFGDG